MALSGPYSIPFPLIQSTKQIVFPQPLTSKTLIIPAKTLPDACHESTSAMPKFQRPIFRIYQCYSTSSSSIHNVELPCTSPAGIFIKGLPLSTNERRLWKAFSEFGEVTQVEIATDRKSMQSLGFAFVWFSKKESAQSAVDEMSGKFFDGRFLKVTNAKPHFPKQRPSVTPYKF